MSSMIISCPDCESRFNIDHDRVPPAGRQVRCGKCGHVWRIAADGSSMPATAGGLSISERPDTVNPFGASAPAGGQPPPVGDRQAADITEPTAGEPAVPSAGAPPDDETGAAETSETGYVDKSAAASGSEDAAGAAPLVQGPAMTPNARQKLAEARKGRSRIRFLIIALVLVIVAAVAVSFIRQPDSLNDALRNVPGLDDGGSDGGAADESPGVDPG